MQVVHFDTQLERDTYSWVRGTNAYLPRDIAVQWAVVTPDAIPLPRVRHVAPLRIRSL